MATGRDIVDYRGDAAAGLAATPSALAAYGEDNYDKWSETARDVAVNNFAANQIIYKQKIQDRDAAFKMIDDDELLLNEIPEEDRERLDAKKKEIYAIWDKNGGDIYSDPKRYREMQKAIAETKAEIKHSQKWYAYATGELAAMKNYTNPYDQEKAKKAVAKELEKKKGNFWALPAPYAPVTDIDLKVTAAPAIMGAEKKTRDGDDDIITQDVDADATFNAYRRNYTDDRNKEYFNNFIFGVPGKDGGFLGSPNAAEQIARVNAKLKAKGIPELGVSEDKLKPGTYRATSDSPDRIAAKIALADANPISKEVFAEDRARIRVTEQGQRLNYKEAMARLDFAKEEAKANRSAATGAGDPTVAGAVNQWGYTASKMVPFTAPAIGGGNVTTFRIPASALPAGYRMIGGVVNTEDDKKNITQNVQDLKPLEDGNYGVEFFSGGRKLNERDFEAQYRNDLINGIDGRKLKPNTTFEDYVQYKINSGGVEYEIVGAEGTRANFGSALHSARYISNKAGTGKETPVFAPQ